MSDLKRISSQFLASACRFSADKSGAFAPTIGVTIMAAALCAGLAVDYTRMMQARTIVDDALDAAILAAGVELSNGGKSDAEVRQVFDDFFESNLENRNVAYDQVSIVDFQIDSQEGMVSAKTKTDVDMAFMGLMGTTSVAIGSDSEARFSPDSIEVAMVLDITGSMGESVGSGSRTKLAALKQAARDAVEILIPEETNSEKMRIGLVPYSGSVNAGSYARTATGGRTGYRNCVTERGGPNGSNDASYTKSPVGADRRVNWWNCPTQDIQPLTNDRRQLLRDINSYRDDGWTAGHIGIAWGYYMLSENWKSLWPKASDPADYDDQVKKIAIVMTDGEFNTYFDGVRRNPYEYQQAASNGSAKKLCADMKAPKGKGDGITVYTIAFQLDIEEEEAREMLEDCATPDTSESTYFFDTDNEQELREAFQKIALDIQKLRLSK